MGLFKKEVKDELAYEDPSQEKGPSLVEKVVKHKFFIPGVAIVVLLILVKILFGVFASQNSSLSYYDTMASIFTNELGSFTYTFSVETGEKGTIIKENVAPDFEEIESGADIDGSDSSSGREFVDWDKYAEVKLGNWQHPVYKVTISGTTMSLDPLQTKFTVSVATSAWNDKFTEVVVRDDTYYIDVESMYNWLDSSKDEYLMSLVEGLPRGSKWLEIPASEFAVPSRYAEVGDEQGLSAAHSLKTLYRRFLVTLKTAVNSVSGAMGERGVEKKNDVVYVNLAGDDAAAFASAIKSIFTRGGDFYTSVINAAVNEGLYDESQYKQAMREKDNFIAALSDMAMAVQMYSASDLGLQASGQVRQYTNGYGNNQIEGTFGIQFSSDTTDYIIKFVGVRSGDKSDVVVPEGTKVSDNVDLYMDCWNKVVDYFNFTPIKTDVKLSINPDTIAESILDQFIKLVNDTGSAGYWVTRANVHEFIEKYKDFDDTQVQTADDLKNTLLVSDLMSALDKVVIREIHIDNAGVGGDTTVSTDPERFPSVTVTTEGGAQLHFSRNAELSNHDLFVVDVDVQNRSEEDMTIICTDFTMQNLLGSLAPANNETLVRNYDNSFDMSLLQKEVVVPASGLAEFKLYFVIAEDGGHMDLIYNGTQLGALIEY